MIIKIFYFFQRTDEDDISSENDDTEYNAAQSGKFLPGQGFDWSPVLVLWTWVSHCCDLSCVIID